MTTKDKTVPFINEINCDEEVYKKGSVFEILDIPKEKANEYCRELNLSDDSYIYDWHYFGGRVVVKRLLRNEIPVPFIKASELIKKEILYKYIHSWNQPESLSITCFTAAKAIYDRPKYHVLGMNNPSLLISKYKKLAKRLEREFLRKEEKEKETDRTITIKSYDIENIEFIKVVGTFNPSLLVNVLNRMRTKIFFEKFLTNGCGVYIFGIEAENICDYEFELIDFKPLD